MSPYHTHPTNPPTHASTVSRHQYAQGAWKE